MKRYQLRTIAAVVILILTAIPTSFLYLHSKKAVISEAGKEAKEIGIAITNFLEWDIEQYKNLNERYEAEAYDQQYYRDMLGLFQSIRAETGADYIFTEKLISNDSIAYILDGEPTDSEYFSPIGTRDAISEPEWEAFQTGKPTSTGLIQDAEWGYYITGFAPILDPESNEVIGLVGVDYSADYISAILNELHTAMLLVYVSVAAALYVLVLIAAKAYKKRLNLDFLTGLYNRKHFEEELQRVIKMTNAKKQAFTVMIIDVDNFKQINDRYGHDVGDMALKRVAQFLSANLKEFDMAFRYGGDEFSVILVNSTKEQAAFVSKRLTLELASSALPVNQEQTIRIQVSIGLSEYHSGMSAATLIHSADQQMYRAKFSKMKSSI